MDGAAVLSEDASGSARAGEVLGASSIIPGGVTGEPTIGVNNSSFGPVTVSIRSAKHKRHDPKMISMGNIYICFYFLSKKWRMKPVFLYTVSLALRPAPPSHIVPIQPPEANTLSSRKIYYLKSELCLQMLISRLFYSQYYGFCGILYNLLPKVENLTKIYLNIPQGWLLKIKSKSKSLDLCLQYAQF